MADFKLDPLTGDLDFGVDNAKGLQLHTDEGQEAIQRIGQALSINLAEWFADISKGVPYLKNPDEDLIGSLRYLLGSKLSESSDFIALSLSQHIEDLPFISRVESIYEYDRKTRIFLFKPKIWMISGASFEFPSLALTL